MFTGLVAERGRLSTEPAIAAEGAVRLRIGHGRALGERLEIGGSLAVAGACLTVIERGAGECTVELSPETVARTTLGRLRAGDEVNLELPLRLGDALGGHWVQGHVDAMAEVLACRLRGNHREVRIASPQSLRPFLVEKGSVALDGVSLTLSASESEWFEVALIPHTLAVTTLSALAPGRQVNLEADILAKYVRQALAARGWAQP